MQAWLHLLASDSRTMTALQISLVYTWYQAAQDLDAWPPQNGLMEERLSVSQDCSALGQCKLSG